MRRIKPSTRNCGSPRVYFLLEKFDEARVLLRYLQPFADDPGQKKQIQYYLVLTYGPRASWTRRSRLTTPFNPLTKAIRWARIFRLSWAPRS